MNADGAPKIPKIGEIAKMLVFPIVLYFSKSIDFKNPQIVLYCQQAFGVSIALVLGIYGFLYMKINSKNDKKEIWVPPKAKPSLPFGLGPPEEPVKPEDYEHTNYKDYELKLIKDAVQQLLFSCVIAYFVSTKFEIYLSLLVQTITTPMGLIENALVLKYILGKTKNSDGTSLYNEQFKAPTKESIAMAERIAAALANKTTPEEETKETPSVAVSAIKPDEPRVEELNESDSSEKKSAKPSTGKKLPAASPASELD